MIPISRYVRLPRIQYSLNLFKFPIVRRIFSRLVASLSPAMTNRQADRWAMVTLAIMQMMNGEWDLMLVGRVSRWSSLSMASRHLVVWSSRSAKLLQLRVSEGARGAHRDIASIGLYVNDERGLWTSTVYLGTMRHRPREKDRKLTYA